MEPKPIFGVMVSSTFSDLVIHRREVNQAIAKSGFHPNVMEFSGAQADTDVIETSLKMVRESAAFVGVISHRYGQTPVCQKRNPDRLSISELEFNEAMRLKRPILLFIMSADHAVKPAEVESNPDKKEKLNAFRERAKKMHEDSEVDRIYEEFDSVDDFAKKAAVAVNRLVPSLNAIQTRTETKHSELPDELETALPPALRAIPRYLGSHPFLGRAAELDTLNDWCNAADPYPMLLFEAIGGTGKSILTWTWLREYLMTTRDDWAGRFWFSFYEGGATMNQFCREALVYMTGANPKTLRKQKTSALMPMLIKELEARPWMLVLDGLERVLVAYHRLDAPLMRDDDVDDATDQMAARDPLDAINPEDEELLRQLTAAAPSKILVSSRLTPKALVNNSGLPMPGVRREALTGLRPDDAEALFRACGIKGDSRKIRDYLRRNCDCHPLVIGALAGMINAYLPDRGNFDRWVEDPEAGGSLGLEKLDLTQRKNHIVDSAIAQLDDAAKRLLQTLSLLHGSADYDTLQAFNPHMPPEPKEPKDPSKDFEFRFKLDEKEQAAAKQEYDTRKNEYEAAKTRWEQSPARRDAPKLLELTIFDLEKRGLLQYDHRSKTYDLHPVVRGVTSGRMGKDQTRAVGELVVDHFSAREHTPWNEAETLDHLAPGIQMVSTLTQMGELERALEAYRGSLARALTDNFMDHSETLRLLRPFFPNGWLGRVALKETLEIAWVMHKAGASIESIDLDMGSALVLRSLKAHIDVADVRNCSIMLANYAVSQKSYNKLRNAYRLQEFGLNIAKTMALNDFIFVGQFSLYSLESICGMYDSADARWKQLDSMPRPTHPGLYRLGQAELLKAEDAYRRETLTKAELDAVEALFKKGRFRAGLVSCYQLRGSWHLSRSEPQLAIAPLTEAIRLLREARLDALHTEALLTLAQLQSGEPIDQNAIIERFRQKSEDSPSLAYANLWKHIGQNDLAISTANRVYKIACADGEPYVYRSTLEKAGALLVEFGLPLPPVPKHDPKNDEVFDFEEDLKALIVKVRKEQKKKEIKKPKKTKKQGG